MRMADLHQCLLATQMRQEEVVQDLLNAGEAGLAAQVSHLPGDFVGFRVTVPHERSVDYWTTATRLGR